MAGVLTVKRIIYQVLRKTMRVFQEFEEVTSGLNGLCIAHAHEWRIRKRLVFLMIMTTSPLAKQVSSGK